MEITTRLYNNFKVLERLNKENPIITELEVHEGCKSCHGSLFEVSIEIDFDCNKEKLLIIKAKCKKCPHNNGQYVTQRGSFYENYNDDDFKFYVLKPTVQAVLEA